MWASSGLTLTQARAWHRLVGEQHTKTATDALAWQASGLPYARAVLALACGYEVPTAVALTAEDWETARGFAVMRGGSPI